MHSNNPALKIALPLAVSASLGIACLTVSAVSSAEPFAPRQAMASSLSFYRYADGTYTSAGKGIGGKVPVTVTIKGGRITSVEVGDNSETEGIGSKAIEQLPEKIVEANGTEGVDALSGASVTSKAIFSAVEDCLKEAGELSSTQVFSDVSLHAWYTDWVVKAYNRGLMTGYTDGNGISTGRFGTEDPVTRAQVATVLWRIAGSPSTNTTALWDARGHWAEKAIAWCQSKGIVTGYTDGQNKGSFCPDANVTREEFATMVCRFAQWAGFTISGAPTHAFYECADTNLVSWSRDYMVWCSAKGVMTGKDINGTLYLAPQETATRAQAAKILVRISQLTEDLLSSYSLDEADAAVSLPDDEVSYDTIALDDVATDTVVSFEGVEEQWPADASIGANDSDGEDPVGAAQIELSGEATGTDTSDEFAGIADIDTTFGQVDQTALEGTGDIEGTIAFEADATGK